MKNILIFIVTLMLTVSCYQGIIYDDQGTPNGFVNATQGPSAGNVNDDAQKTDEGNINDAQGVTGGNVNNAQGATDGNVNGAQGTTDGNVNGAQGANGGNVNGAQGTTDGNVNGAQGASGGNVNDEQGMSYTDGFVQGAQGSSVKRKWTFIIYMAADNDLESAAIADINELEAVNYGAAPISILALVDRHNDYDMTNGNWSDTRLFEIKPDPNGSTSTIRSSRIDCFELGLSKNSETELNMSDPLVLSRLIDFAKRVYPADNYALFMWGHGTGWRGGTNNSYLPEPVKAVAFDDTSRQYMSLPAFGRAVAGKGLSVIGFDTCFGALLEVAYQIKNSAELFIGSEGEIASTGWDYTTLFSGFLSKENLSISDLGNAIQNQFSKQYASQNKATISQIQLSKVNDLFLRFNDFSGAVAKAITTRPARDTVMNQILNSVERYFFTSFPSDMYVDIFDFTKKISAIRGNITSDTAQQNAISEAANKLEAALTLAVPSSWAKDGTTKKIGVHAFPLMGAAVPATTHELAYIRGSMTLEKSAFVENSEHWVPNAIPKSDSLLDKLLYWTYTP